MKRERTVDDTKAPAERLRLRVELLCNTSAIRTADAFY